MYTFAEVWRVYRVFSFCYLKLDLMVSSIYFINREIEKKRRNTSKSDTKCRMSDVKRCEIQTVYIVYVFVFMLQHYVLYLVYPFL